MGDHTSPTPHCFIPPTPTGLHRGDGDTGDIRKKQAPFRCVSTFVIENNDQMVQSKFIAMKPGVELNPQNEGLRTRATERAVENRQLQQAAQGGEPAAAAVPTHSTGAGQRIMKRKAMPKRQPKNSATAVSEDKEAVLPPEGVSFPVVGIGASAGGLEALEQFFGHVPAGSGMAFVVVQHLDPTRKGILTELLQRATGMKVLQVRDRTKVQPDCVYVIPPNKDMSILHGVLHLIEPAAPRGLRLPIDFFLRSLAQDLHERSVGVDPFGHGIRRHPGPEGHQGEGGAGAGAGTGIGQIRRDAAQRD